jgi:hypothetical protein
MPASEHGPQVDQPPSASIGYATPQLRAKSRESTARQRRVRSLLQSINGSAIEGTGLEVGPLCDPLFTRAQADVRYIDIHDADTLRAHYASDPAVVAADIVEPDFVIIGPDGPRTVREAVGASAVFDWVVASHVVEHVPNLIGWLADLGDVLVDDGRLVLVIPDGRYCFDAARELTTVGELLLAHDHGDRVPSVRAVYDHYSRAVSTSTTQLWNGIRVGKDARLHTIEGARNITQKCRLGDYIDCHCWVFTPESFLTQLAELGQLELCDYAVEQLVPTARNELEFYVLLRRLPRTLSGEALSRARSASLQSPAGMEPGALVPSGSGARGSRSLNADELSAFETHLIRYKRSALVRLRGLRARVTSRV